MTTEFGKNQCIFILIIFFPIFPTISYPCFPFFHYNFLALTLFHGQFSLVGSWQFFIQNKNIKGRDIFWPEFGVLIGCGHKRYIWLHKCMKSISWNSWRPINPATVAACYPPWQLSPRKSQINFAWYFGQNYLKICQNVNLFSTALVRNFTPFALD